MSKPSSNDPFAEEEVTYVGPGKDTDSESADDAPFGDTYDLDGDDADVFDFGDDTPNEWAPPVTPDESANRKPTVTDDDPEEPPRSAAVKPPREGTVTLDATDVSATEKPRKTTETKEAASQDSDDDAPAPPKPRLHETPELDTQPRKTFMDRLKALFGGGQVEDDPGGQELRSLQRGLAGTINVAIINRKGGVGKTLSTVLAGQTLATHRKDRVIAVDASPEGGELINRVPREQNGSVRSLLNQLSSVKRYSHVRTHTSQDQDSGLEVLGSNPDSVGDPELLGEEYERLLKVLRSYYDIIITDCAQGFSNDVMESVLENTDVLIVVSEGYDGMSSAYWVANQLADPAGRYKGRFSHLVDDMIVVVTERSPNTNVNTQSVIDGFTQFARRVIDLPYDQTLEGGRPFSLDEVAPTTRQAGIDIATAIATSTAFQGGGR